MSEHSSPVTASTSTNESYTYARGNTSQTRSRERRDKNRTSFSPSSSSPMSFSGDNSPNGTLGPSGDCQLRPSTSKQCTLASSTSQANTLPSNSPDKADALELEKLQLLEMLKKLDEDEKHMKDDITDDSPMIIGSDDDEEPCISPQLMVLTSESDETSPITLSKDVSYLPDIQKVKQKLSFQNERTTNSLDNSSTLNNKTTGLKSPHSRKIADYPSRKNVLIPLEISLTDPPMVSMSICNLISI